MNEVLVGLASIVVLGVAAQTVASRLRVPAILLLLGTGILVGPVLGLLHPDRLLGDLLLPLVSLAVALILYEGGLTLRLRELTSTGGVVSRLVTVGAAVTWVGAAAGAYLLLGLDVRLCLLLGAILVVTGPTVIQPMLQHIRPTGRVGSVLKWEGIVIDPIGAMLAVLAFEVVFHRGLAEGPVFTLVTIGKTLLIGGGLGLLAAGLLIVVMRYYLVPGHLQNAVSLALAVAAFTASNVFQDESGLLATTLMGVVLANQRLADVRHIVEFKENLTVLLIGTLFILLGARLEWGQLAAIHLDVLVFIAVLIVVVRPVGVLLSTLGSQLSWRERVFLSALAPRGIVAAAVASVFAIALAEAGYANADVLATVTFAVILGTVGFYGLVAPLVAFRLKLAESQPQGLLIAGADAWVRATAKMLVEQGYRVVLVDTNPANIAAARMAGLTAWSGSILAERLVDEVDFGGIGRFLALTPNDWVNERAADRFCRLFGKVNVYQLPSKNVARDDDPMHGLIAGRALFGPDVTYRVLQQRFYRGGTIKVTRLSEQFTYKDYRAQYHDAVVPLFVITDTGRLNPVTDAAALAPMAGQTVISMVEEQAQAEPGQALDQAPQGSD